MCFERITLVVGIAATVPFAPVSQLVDACAQDQIWLRQFGPGSGDEVNAVASDGARGDQFGFSVSISSQTAVVGARGADAMGANSGAAYVFAGVGGVWSETDKLTASDGAPDDLFAQLVSIDADTAVISSHLDDDQGHDSGSAYVFGRAGGPWNEDAKTKAADGKSGNNFGITVSVNGKSAAVGAAFDSSVATDGGSTYMFDLNCSCYADCEQSTGVGVLDIFDFLCLQNSFVNSDPYACDCDTSTGVGVCDVFDFLCFQNAFVSGCP